MFYNTLQSFHNTGQVIPLSNNCSSGKVINTFLCQIIVDFNINVLSSTNDDLQHSSMHMLIVGEPTHISGSLIDHVCIRNNSEKKFSVQKTDITSQIIM